VSHHGEGLTVITFVISTGPRYVGALGRLIIWRPFRAIFFKLFRPRTGPASCVPKLRIILGEIISRVET
jgi:hypothetical protein